MNLTSLSYDQQCSCKNWFRKHVITWKPMIWKKLNTILRGCTKMAHRHSCHERYIGYQATCQPTDTGTDQTAGDSSPCHIYPKCHKICSPSKQAEIEWDNRCSTNIKWRFKFTNQYYRGSDTIHQIPTNVHLHAHHTSLSPRFHHLYEASCHTHSGLCGCIYHQYVVTWHTHCERPKKYSQTHRI